MKHIFSSNIKKTRTSTTAESSTYPKTEIAWICLYFLQFRNAKGSNYVLSFAIMRCCLGGSTSISIKFRKALDLIILVLIIYPYSYFRMPFYRSFQRIRNTVFLLQIFECVIAWNKIFSNEKLDSYFSQSMKESAINSVNMVFH